MPRLISCSRTQPVAAQVAIRMRLGACGSLWRRTRWHVQVLAEEGHLATTVAPFGAWKSPISADLLASAGVALAQIELDGDDIYWLDSRPQEGGRSVVVRRTPDGQRHDVTPPGFNARTRVHEYGGGSYAVANGTVYFTNFADQRIYRQDDGGAPRALTPE